MTKQNAYKIKKLSQGILFGLIFGFLLQKGGVANYSVLEGQLLLTDFTVIKVMLSAILVAMLGIFILHKLGKVKLHIKPTEVGANITGGLIFGIGFALSGYCPGTGAAGLGQGNIATLIFMSGLVVGSYIYAEVSGIAKNTIKKWGDRGKMTIHMLAKVNTGPSVAFSAVVLSSILILLWKYNL